MRRKEATKMKYELKTLESLIRNVIESVARNGLPHEKSDLVRQRMSAEMEQFKEVLANTVFSLDPEQAAIQYVQHHQQAVINFIDHFQKAHNLQADAGIAAMLDDLTEELEATLEFMERHFIQYFNLDARIPASFRLYTLTAFRKTVTYLETTWAGFQPDRALIDISLHEMARLLEDSTRDVCYRELIFIKGMQREFLAINNLQPPGPSINDKINSVLFYLNYNSPGYFRYFTAVVQKKINGAETLAGCLEQLAYHYKVVNQALVKPLFAFDVGFRPLKEQVSEWIYEEIQYLETKQKLSTGVNDKIPASDDFKITVDMPGSHFALFVRAFVETELIKNKNLSELMRFLSKFIRTKRAETITYETFRARYYNVEATTREAVRTILLNLANHISRN